MTKVKGHIPVHLFIPEGTHEEVRYIAFKKKIPMAQVMRAYISRLAKEDYQKLQVTK